MKKLLSLALCLLAVMAGRSQTSVSELASRFIQTLRNDQFAKMVLDAASQERFNWHFFPKDDRKGISLNELDQQQKEALQALMQACFSARGLTQLNDVRQREGILKQMEQRPANDHYRDTGKYFVLFFGYPKKEAKWAWRFEGHHISYSFVVSGDQIIAGTPGFLGANPAIVPAGAVSGPEIMRDETSLAFDLLHSLRREQAAQAIVSRKAPGEILSFVSRKAVIENPGGIAYSRLNREQQYQLLRLIEIYVNRYSKLFADDLLRRIHAAGLDKLQFAWAGSTLREEARPYYYRISGPAVLIEYDNAQNNANHIHTVVRDLQYDFGGDILLDHYQQEHGNGANKK